MPEIAIARPKKRRGLFISRGLSRKSSILMPLDGTDKGEIDQLVRAILAKQGVTEEGEIQKIVEAAEQDYEMKIKVAEARAELRRLMGLRAQGHSLIQKGYRKWTEAFFAPIKVFKQQ